MAKYGKISNDNRGRYRNDVNYLHHKKGYGPARISRILEIGEVTVERLIVYDKKYIDNTT